MADVFAKNVATSAADAEKIVPRAEFRVFGKETVPGVDGVDMRLVRGFHDGRDVGRRALRVGSAQCVGLVGGVHEQRVRVGVGIGGDGDAAGVMAGVDNAHGDFATVGDEDAP